MSRGHAPVSSLDALKEAFLKNASSGGSAEAKPSPAAPSPWSLAAASGPELRLSAPQIRETHKPDTDRAQGRR